MGKWEDVLRTHSETVERMRIEGGWLYRSWIMGDAECADSQSMVFVPAPVKAPRK